MDDTSPALVLGGTGSFGGAMARELSQRGRPVRLLARNPARAEAALAGLSGIDVQPGDVLDATQVKAAASGCDLIVHGVNYPYDKWVPYMHTATLNVIAAARAAGASVVFPGNIYGYGIQASAPLTEDAPMQPNSRKGRFRVRLEETLEAATREPAPEPEPGPAPPAGAEAAEEVPPLPPIRVLIVRGGDYFGPTVGNELQDWVFARAKQGKAQTVFGRLDAGHEYLYVPDLARAAVDLLALGDRLAPFEVVNVPGYVADSQRAFCAAVAAAAGHPGLVAKAMPWWMVRLFGLFNGPARELLEMRYLFENPVRLDGSKLQRLLPDFEPTPLEAAIRETLARYS